MNATANPIMDVLQQSQDGKLVATLGKASMLDEARGRAALDRLTPDIARRIADLASNDEAYEDLLEILDEEEQVEYLDSAAAMLSRNSINDGEDILKQLYGSLDGARATALEIGAPNGVDDEIFVRIMTLAASLTLAAMARRSQQFQLGVVDNKAAETKDDGIVAMLISALVAGLLQGLKQAVRPRRRRRRRNILTSIFGDQPKRRRRTTRKRKTTRRKTPSLNDLLGDLLRG